jgi:hypothetical protein
VLTAVLEEGRQGAHCCLGRGEAGCSLLSWKAIQIWVPREFLPLPAYAMVPRLTRVPIMGSS